MTAVLRFSNTGVVSSVNLGRTFLPRLLLLVLRIEPSTLHNANGTSFLFDAGD